MDRGSPEETTHYFPGGVLPSALLLCLLDIAIAFYLAWSLWHVR
jgi:hypothetical protein